MAVWKRRMSPKARAVFDAFERVVASCGTYHLSPAKTRITVLAEVRFAGVSAPAANGLTVSFALPKPVKSARLTRVKEEIPGWWSHHLVVRDPSEFDAELIGWIRQSYRLMGLRERLKG
jgi:hypothetical protein